MKKLNLSIGFCIFLVCALFSEGISSQTVINSQTFESGTGIWSLSGSATRLNNTNPSCGGNYSIRLQQNSSAQMVTSPLNITSFNQVDISFCHKANNNVDTNEGFNLEYYDGTSWHTLQQYRRGTEFTTTGNNNPHSFSFSITTASYTFSTNSRFRITNNTNANNERNFIDNITIEGINTTPTYSNVSVTVNWPSWSGENRVEIYEPNGTLITTIDDGYNGSNGSYNNTFNLGCLLDASNYYIVMYDSYGDGWNGADNITITVGGSTVLNMSNNNILTGAGTSVNFNVSGSSCAINPEINITGNGNTILNGATTPTSTNNTSFGNIDVASGSLTHTFTIENSGIANLNLTGSAPYVSISGTNASDFSVTVTPNNNIASGDTTTFNITFNPGAVGTRTATITINNDDSDESTYTFSIEGNGTDPCGSTINTFPYTENFETNTVGAWIQDSADNFNWTVNNGGTPSSNTGPNTAAQGSYYIFTEASNPRNNGDVTNLESPCFNLTTLTNPEFSFSYHMYGATMGTLYVDISTDSGATFPTTIWSQSGQVQTSYFNAWTPVTINLSAYTGQTVKLRLRGVIGNDYRGDIAVDDIELRNAAPTPEINVVGNGISIFDGDITPSTTDNTDFGNVLTTSTTKTHLFTIENLGTSNTLTLSGASPYISITGAHASDFTLTTIPNNTIAAGSSTNFEITFNPSNTGIRTAIITINNNDTDEGSYTFNIQGSGVLGPPQYTAYYETFDSNNGGWTPVTSTNDTWVWTNTFTTTDEIGEGSFWRNSNYNSYVSNTNIVIESPQLNFSGLQNLKFSIDIKYNTENNNDGMRILYSVGGGPFTVLGASGSGTNWYNDNVAALGSDGWNNDGHTATPSFTPHSQFGQSSIELLDAIFSNQSNVRFRIQFSSNASNNYEGVAFDNVLIEADPITSLNTPTTSPGSAANNLRLWLKANAGITATDGNALTLWEDQAFDTALDKEDATTAMSVAPTYRDNTNRNINFNPAVDFNHNNLEYMNGKGGFYSKEYFVVVKSNDVVNTNTGSFNPGRQFVIGGRYSDDSFHEDPTGLGFGSVSSRYSNEIISHNISSFPNGSSSAPNATSYGRSYSSATDAFQNHPLIINVKTNAAGTASEIYKNGKQIDNTTGVAGNGANLNFNEFSNLQFLIGIGRSGITGRTTSQMNGLITEIISYTSPNSAINQQKIHSYLAVKYGTTLQATNSVLTNYRINDINYIDSQGVVIWNTNNNAGFNYDVAGIGRDDASSLNQKQSKSQNTETDGTGAISGLITIGLSNIYNTNNTNISTNTTTLNDRAFLMWGNNGADLNLTPTTIHVDMSAGISGLSTPVSLTAMQRVWKIVETGGDVPSCKIKIPENALRNMTPPGNFYMFISNSPTFTPTADYRIMTPDGNGNLETNYNFDGASYITFGYAPQIIAERSIYFDGTSDYIDVDDHLDLNSTEFTISAWIKRDAGTVNASIVSKRNAANTEGYDFRINASGHVQFSANGGARLVTSSVAIPSNKWHQVAVVYNSGRIRLYIDGVADTSAIFFPAPISTSQSFIIGAADGYAPNTTNFFAGNIDEVRVWNTALSANQLRYIMNQELMNNASLLLEYGDVIPQTVTNNEINSIPWSNLAGYYPMQVFTYTNTNDMSGNEHQGALRNLNTVDRQTAPLPYKSNNNGSWDTNTTWLNGNVQTLPNALSIVDGSAINWNIVEINNNIYLGANATDVRHRNCAVQGLIINSGKLTINGDTAATEGIGLTVTHYLKLDGTIDLEGESQLIQTENSDFDTSSTGNLERDQQGTANTYLYNYWSSPVSTTSNANYTVPSVLPDLNFLSAGYNGTASPIAVADYWIWKYSNRTSNTYSEWQHVRSSGTLAVGEGFTMKGPGTSGTNQNYVFNGQPNNGDINLIISAGNDYLTGNPYPSALDANEFILDNLGTISGGRNPSGNIINGALYFWDHFAVNSHNLAEYQGGYATYTLIGGIVAISNDLRINASGLLGINQPERYIPVGQGFFVSSSSSLLSLSTLFQPIVGGTLQFKNSQRVFAKETSTFTNSGSLFLKSNSKTNKSNIKDVEIDTRPKIRLLFSTPKGYHRQLLVGTDNNASNNFDLGYDAPLIETNIEDVYWTVNSDKFVIQAVNNFDDSQVLPLGVTINKAGLITLKIDYLENIDDNKTIFIHDKALNIYHNLKDGNYQTYMNTGEYLDRFELTFSATTAKSLSSETFETKNIQAFYANNENNIVIINSLKSHIKSVSLHNVLGQLITNKYLNTNDNYITLETFKLQAGTYILNVYTDDKTISKKVLIN
ncbi:choice-of-anchor D domain-containing protein [Seonamhaeicola algicola]|uniref:Choice-of-anchor D domain-containing protein n=1 Tax=Seonamhaeicola algicola TaxID=1719036 RepID=A0A5C7B0E1_9FLAO|nr:choice-of-anchor D domain-containing protein [Seonamhaeicola algicola]TXE13917.1 choice-of-anchor D domain-containing protein [Seonamhaeicola algicola]